MATVNGMTAEAIQAILDETMESAEISGASLVFHRHDGSSFSAGNFTTFIGDAVADAVDTAMTDEVLPAIRGGLTAMGSISGAITFPGQTPESMLNRIFTVTLTGNVTLNATAFPSPALAGTQFAIRFTQDATGGRTLTLTGIKRSQGVLALSTGAGAIDIITFMYDGTNWYAGPMGVAFS